MLRSLPLLALLLCACPATPPAVTPDAGGCAGDLDCGQGRCLAGKCFDRACATQTCGLAEVCIADTCTDERCVGINCPPGNVCTQGVCYDTRCGGSQCPADQVCANDACVESACVGVVCPTAQRCQGGVCRDVCAGVMCATSETCRDGACVNACIGVTCNSGQLCRNGACVDVCAGVNCTATEVCRNGACVDSCLGVSCDGGTSCLTGSCVDDACLTVRCSAGRVCSLGNCIEPACVGVSCTVANQTCSAGTCVDRCTVECGGTCPLCPAGRTCTGNSGCDSHLCKAGICTACDTTTNTCPNGATCMNGICRSGVGGPCAAVTDCDTGLVCEDLICKLPAGSACTATSQCVKSVICENLVCQRPRCQLQLLESQTVPNYIVPWNTLISGYVPATGEVYVSHGQWDNNYTNSNVRRFRVAPGQAPVEQSPTAPPLLALAVNDPTPQGSPEFGGSASSAYAGRSFYWYPGGGPWDGRLAMKLDFINFNADISVNLNNGGRFASCGTEWIFLSNVLSAPKAMLKFTTPQVVGTSAQTALINLTASSARRDTWPYPAMMDLKCFNGRVWALGNSGGVVGLTTLSLSNLAPDGTPPVSFPGLSPLNGGLDEAKILPVTDSHYYVVSRSGPVYELYNGRQERIGAVTGEAAFGNPKGLITYGGGVVRRYEKRMMDGSVPPLDTICQWQ